MTPRVSVVIPNFNYAQYLGRAVDSVLGQSMGDFELIVVDNRSTDESEEVVRSRRDSRVAFHSFANHGVIARSRNFGLSLAKGEFVAFLDSDDLWFPDKLDEQIRAMRSRTFASFHNLEAISHGFPKTIRGFNVREGKALAQMLTGGNPVPLSSVMCRTATLQTIGGFPEEDELTGVEDYALWLRGAALGLDFKFLPVVLGAYRIHESTSSSIDISARTRRLVESYSSSLNHRQRRLSQGLLYYSEANDARIKKLVADELWSLARCMLSGNWKFVWRASFRFVQTLLLSLVSFNRKSKRVAGDA